MNQDFWDVMKRWQFCAYVSVGLIAGCSSMVSKNGNSSGLSNDTAFENGSHANQDSQDQPFDVNDVSFLIPAVDDPARQIKVTEAGPLGPLLTEQHVEALKADFIDRGHRDKSVQDILNNLRITGFRYDPCPVQVPDTPDFSKCPVPFMTLRLVAQVFDGVSQISDSSIHLIYAIPATKRDQVTGEIRGLKNLALKSGFNTNGQSLGIHPALKGLPRNDSGSVAFFNAFKGFLLQNAGKANFIKVATMVTLSGGSPSVTWEWVSFSIEPPPSPAGANGVPVRTKIDGVSGTPDRHTFKGLFRSGSIDPDSLAKNDSLKPPVKALDIEKIMVDNPKPFDQEAAAYDAAHFMMNPKLITIPQGDCASCHLATPTLEFADSKLGKQKDSVFTYKAAPGVTITQDPGTKALMVNQNYMVLNFGLFFGAPAVSQRTINESAEVVRILNAQTAKARLAAFDPSIRDESSSNDPAKQPEFKKTQENFIDEIKQKELVDPFSTRLM